MDEDECMARIAAGVIEHFDIGLSETVAELDRALRSHAYLIRQIGAVRPDLYDRLKDLAQKRRAFLSQKDTRHGQNHR